MLLTSSALTRLLVQVCLYKNCKAVQGRSWERSTGSCYLSGQRHACEPKLKKGEAAYPRIMRMRSVAWVATLRSDDSST